MLKSSTRFPQYKGPIVTIVMDGYGISSNSVGNAITKAYTPTLTRLFAEYPNTLLRAHGSAVGLPSEDDMGNSEVGHNALGSGQIYAQGAKLVNASIASGDIFKRKDWLDISKNAQDGHTLHLMGLFSDGNVHSHIDHLKALILQAKSENIKTVRLHILLDGRDVGEASALDYVEPFEKFLDVTRSSDFDVCIASGGGRMRITMDRYDANWKMVEEGWKIHVLGLGRQFNSTVEAITTYREEATVIDQDLPPFVIAKNGKAVGTIEDGDSVVFFNFRGDRAIEITKAFTEIDFKVFDRVRFPKVVYAGMLQYDGDLKLPERFLVAPPIIKNTMGEGLAKAGVSQLAVSETQKFGHVTYFWNGNRSGKFDNKLETYIEIPSDVIPFEQRPWMKAAEATDALIAELRTGKYRSARINYPNGDMVGHTGIFLAAVIAVEAVDLALSRLLPVIDELGGMAIITADHGNADEMYELDKKSGKPAIDKKGKIKAKTSHTLNPVPVIFYDNIHKESYEVSKDPQLGLANLATSTVNLLGFEAPEIWEKGILKFKD